MLKKGDTCYVRLISGAIVEAKYHENTGGKNHFVDLPDGRLGLTMREIHGYEDDPIPDCRFVCMTGIKGER